MTLNLGLTEKGFVSPTYEEFLDDIEDEMRSSFGNDLTLTPNSTAGILARLFARKERNLCQQLELVYYSAFDSTATNTALDRLGANVGVPRKVAMPSNVTILITTDGEYLVEAGEEFETDDGYVFELTDDILTTQQTDGTWSGTGNAQSEDTGEDTNVLANTITIMSNPDDQVLSVTNPSQASGGQDQETDAAYRTRLIMENQAKTGPTKNGIESALYNVAGVRDVGIVDNSTNATDADGNPPYSVHIYVLGGKDSDIAQALADNVAAGVTLAGSKTVKVTDANGFSKNINFDSATTADIYVKVQVTTNDDWNSDSGIDDIKQLVVDQIKDLKMGQKINLTKLYPTVYSEAGVDEATITIGTSKEALAANDIQLKRYEAPVCDASHVEVDVNGNN